MTNTKKMSDPFSWHMHDLVKFAQTWRESLDKRKRLASVYSSYWTFIQDWRKNIIHWLSDFSRGQYHFEPAIHCYFLKEHCTVWGFKDRLFLALIYRIIKPTFQAIIPKACVHLNGPSQGIPMRSSLSPFFGALYLKPLDEVFSNRDNVFYVRYMDDIFILFKTKRQFLRARKRIFGILRQLKLVISPNKSSMGKLEGKALHFLRSKMRPAERSVTLKILKLKQKRD